MIYKISSPNAPSAVGPYSQAIRTGDLLFVSGQLPIVPATGQFCSDDAVMQARQCLENIAAIAHQAGTALTNTVKTTVMLTDLSEFAPVNEVYAEFFSEPCPARACYEVKALPKGAKVEIEAIIAIPES
ncbi:RidA family protein [Pseudomonas aeruginosa]|uniref:RidA family protein n=1 Tax=Pseudomonas aeruginosa TaxID=287 RepID=UPI00071BCF13|nr:RidA family protein [Pseudomonas aeruginosa]KSM46358.1 RidA family protein [Pseudomonas aeruginosa]MCO3228165.1 RidA family protein [Pseudomonas aeruginosa]MDI2463331.1 RidA family protein [Pseudomonas aeruginosa]QQM06885.1 RidA family protein [Pseudomonas aeruginosa]HBO3549834.1 RidA family protein [Pseudomonas aeruginosa]